MTRILLVEDHEGTREEMKNLIHGQGDLSVVAEAASGLTAVEEAARTLPDVVIMDIVLPGINGVEAIRAIVAQRPETKVLALSNYSGHALVQAVLLAGGLGFVRKELAYEELIPAIRAVAAWKPYIRDTAK